MALQENGKISMNDLRTELGIGTNSPDSNLYIRKDVQNGTGPVLKLRNQQYSNNVDATTQIRMGNMDGREGIIQSVGFDGYGKSRLSLGVSDDSGDPEHLTIDIYGNVGIGTTSPSERLEVNGNIKASIFYDITDTAYYVNPSQISRLSSLISTTIECNSKWG